MVKIVCIVAFVRTVVGASSCTSAEQAALQNMDANTLGAASDKCGHGAISLTGINHDKFNKCLSAAVGIGATCSECYAKTADYGFKSCKSACLLGWCKSGCLSCTAPAQTALQACTGVSPGAATPCMEDTLDVCGFVPSMPLLVSVFDVISVGFSYRRSCGLAQVRSICLRD